MSNRKKHRYSWTRVIDNSTQTTEQALEEIFQYDAGKVHRCHEACLRRLEVGAKQYFKRRLLCSRHASPFFLDNPLAILAGEISISGSIILWGWIYRSVFL